MAKKSRQTFRKRQREQAKKQKAKDKSDKRQAKKTDGLPGDADGEEKVVDPDEAKTRTVKGMKVIVRHSE